MSEFLEYIFAMVAIIAIANLLSSFNQNERTYVFPRGADNMESFPAPVRAMLEVNKNLIVDYLDTQWDKDILRLPLIIDYWSHTVHQSISKYGFGGEFAKDFVRHVVDNYGEADYGKRKS